MQFSTHIPLRVCGRTFLTASIFLTALSAPCVLNASASAHVCVVRAGASLRQHASGRTPKRGRALWPGSRFTEGQRARAVRRGLEFIYRTALDQNNFETYGSDYLWCFYTVGASVSDARVRRLAQQMGVELPGPCSQTHRAQPREPD